MVIVAQFQEASSTLLYTATLSTESMKVTNLRQEHTYTYIHYSVTYYILHMSITLVLDQHQDWEIFYHIYSTEMSQNLHQSVSQHSGS